MAALDEPIYLAVRSNARRVGQRGGRATFPAAVGARMLAKLFAHPRRAKTTPKNRRSAAPSTRVHGKTSAADATFGHLEPTKLKVIASK
jgi:hypothetical protein